MNYLSPNHIKKKKIFKPEPIIDPRETEEGVLEVEEEYEKER